MKSTRSQLHRTASQAILNGLSPDGGLFVLEHLNSNFYHTLSTEDHFQSIAYKLWSMILDDYHPSDILDIVERAYSTQSFPNHITNLNVTPTHAYLELYHGPTFAFKDIALQALPLLFDKAKQIQAVSKPTVILTATSGDTGSAALAGFSNLDNTHVIVLYPNQGVSSFQEFQMNAFQNNNNTILAVDGNFDDCQSIVKNIFIQVQPNHVVLSSANSINIGRILPQIVYYFEAYLQLVKTSKIQQDEPINITVPTGNFGNIYAAYLAYRMGLPVHKLILASNRNRVLTDLFETGLYHTNRLLHKTMSPSMDILISSNLERYFYRVSNNNHSIVNDKMGILKQTKQVTLPNLNQDQLFYAGYAREDETLEHIKQALMEEQYLIDPHTAVGRKVSVEYQSKLNDSYYHLIVSTASPYKFSDAIMTALNLSTNDNMKQRFETIRLATNTKYDSRMMEMFDTTFKPNVVSIQEAYEVIKKVIGDLQ